jgi:nitrite reductase/ring-hydroxylating ferredoxin subunit
VYEFDFRCDSCKREYRFRDGKLNEVTIERDAVAEHLAMRKAELDAVRNRRCPHCGGPLDDWLTCEWCHERYSAENGELVSKTEELLKRKPRISEFYAPN